MAWYLSQSIVAYSSAIQSYAEFSVKQSRQKYAYRKKWVILGKNMRTPCNKYFDSSDFLKLLTSILKLLHSNTWWMVLANLVFVQQAKTQKHFKRVKRFSLTNSTRGGGGGANSYLVFFVGKETETPGIELHCWDYHEKSVTIMELDLLFCMWFLTVGLPSFPPSQSKKIQTSSLTLNKVAFSVSCLGDFQSWSNKIVNL